jgi:prepilin-type N-terminal cleavage/methylation domain-containing protein
MEPTPVEPMKKLLIVKPMRAFTLLEILIVLMILALGIAMGVASFSKIQTTASEKTLQAKLKQLNIARDQLIQEYSRLEAESVWSSASDKTRYEYLKRYIEHAATLFSDVAPRGYVIDMPSTVWGHFIGYKNGSSSVTFTEGN